MKKDAENTTKQGSEANTMLAAGWISIETQLPEKWVYVLCYTKLGGIVIACYDDEFKRITYNGNRGSVTHWMPLPSPPACC